MWHSFFSKFIVKPREQVVTDLGLNLPARSYEEHLEDFLTMLIRMVGTLLVAFAVAYYHGTMVIDLLRRPFLPLFEKQPILLDGVNLSDQSLLSSWWVLLALVLCFPLLWAWRQRSRRTRLSAGEINFK